MLPYFPFSNTFDLKMGTAPLPDENRIVEVDEHYRSEVLQKRKLLSEDHPYYYQSSPDTLTAQWEVLEKTLESLAIQHPENFTLQKSGDKVSWENRILQERAEFTPGDLTTLPFEPLDWVGQQVQEDLVILNKQSHLAAGQLCFPSGWCLNEKFNKHFLEIHAPLPSLLNPMLQAADKLIERIPQNKPMARTNWGFRVSDQLDLSSKHGPWYRETLQQVSSTLTKANTGEKIYMRVERQTLSRLAESGYVLFTIHTYNNLVCEEAKDAGRAKAMLTFLSTVPADLLEYKQMTPITKKLLDYLAMIAR
jgi:dimethylamine monooxygenase subunit A